MLGRPVPVLENWIIQSSAFNKQRRFVESLTKQSEIVLRLSGKIEPAACGGGGYPLCCYINKKSETLPGNTKLSELDIEFVLK